MNDFNNTQPPVQPGVNGPQNAYGQPQPMFQPGMNKPVKPDNYLVMSIIATVLGLCSCVPLILGIIAIIFASQVDSKYNAGNYIGAENASKTAKVLSIISLILAILGILFSIMYYIFVGAAAFSGLV